MATWSQNVFTTTQLRRWISPDSIEFLDPESINGLNLYCYCMNNPIMYADPSGHIAISTLLLGMAIGFAVGLGISLFVDLKFGEWISDWIDSITS